MPLGAIHLLLTEVIPRLIYVQPGSSSLMKNLKKKKKRRRSTIVQDAIDPDTEEDTDEYS
eukprot:CAMPEP_0116057504 /NCGR_PEP_ID=MMETSP0322-20121206/4646_1 /TAXON_ID=163516 /ORGANISM="Leptocylindrus danicus var. apora, Strain B651" /LENGTH=59 /DNA_ID=CAMNT_0003541519 /DNA_START=438 /DNA_END=617 /DNA_ORIENTATION=+